MKPVRLRAHHFLCMLTYVGRGYSRTFTRRFDALTRQIARGRAVQLTLGPDDVCAGLGGRKALHCRARATRKRDAAALRDLTRLGVLSRSPMRLTLGGLKRMRVLYAAGLTRRACAACQWKPLCDEVSARGFAGARLD